MGTEGPEERLATTATRRSESGFSSDAWFEGSQNSETETPWDSDWNDDNSLPSMKFNNLNLVKGGSLWIFIVVPLVLVFTFCLACWCRYREDKEAQRSSSQRTQGSAATR